MSNLSLLRLRPNHAGGTPIREEDLPSDAQLSAWRRNLNAEAFSELQSALSEPNSSLRTEALMGFAERQLAAGDLQTAAEVFSIINHPRAISRLQDLQGQGGDWGRRLEEQFRQMSADMLAPANLLAMAGAGLAFQGVRLAGACWTLNKGLGLASRTLGNALVQIGAITAEAGAFTSIQHGYHRLAGAPHSSFSNFARDLASNQLTFGGLRVGSSTLGRVSPVLGLLSGVTLAQQFQIAADLRASQDDTHRLADILVTSAQFFITGQVVGRLPFLQRAWAGAERWAHRVDWARELEAQGRLGEIDLLPAHRNQFLRTLREINSGIRAQDQGRDQLTEILKNDLLTRIQPLIVSTKDIPWQEWINEQRQSSNTPEWVDLASQDLDSKNWMVTRIELDAYRNPEEDINLSSRDYDSINALGGLQTLLQARLGLAKTSMIEQNESTIRLDILTSPFLWRSADYRYGSQGASPEAFPDLVTLPHLGSLATIDVRPILLSGRYVSLHGFNEIHPYVGLVHDIFHLLDINRQSLPSRREISALYQILRWNHSRDPSETRNRDSLLGELLDGMLTDNGDHSTLFFRIFSANFSKGFQENALSLLRSNLRGTPRGREILRQAEGAWLRR